MKFHQLQTGQRFIYKDQLYVKVSPVIARHEDSGEQKFLRRADSVQQLPEQAEPAGAPSIRKHIEIKKVSQQFDEFLQRTQALISSELQDLPPARKEKILAQLQQAGRNFMQGLGRR